MKREASQWTYRLAEESEVRSTQCRNIRVYDAKTQRPCPNDRSADDGLCTHCRNFGRKVHRPMSEEVVYSSLRMEPLWCEGCGGRFKDGESFVRAGKTRWCLTCWQEEGDDTMSESQAPTPEESRAIQKEVSDQQKKEAAELKKSKSKPKKKEKTMSATKVKKAAKATTGRVPTKFRFRASIPKSVLESRGNAGIVAKILEKKGPLTLDELVVEAKKTSDFETKSKDVKNGIGQIIHGFKKDGYVLAER